MTDPVRAKLSEKPPSEQLNEVAALLTERLQAGALDVVVRQIAAEVSALERELADMKSDGKHYSELTMMAKESECKALEARLAAAEGLEKRMRVRCDNADDHWLLLKKSADELSAILKGEGK